MDFHGLKHFDQHAEKGTWGKLTVFNKECGQQEES